MCRLLTTPDTRVGSMVAEFLFILCKEKVGRFVKHTGYGNAAGLLGTIQILRKQTRWVGGLGQILTFAHQVGEWVVPKCVAKNFLYKL